MKTNLKKMMSIMLIMVMMLFCFTGCIRYRTTMGVKKNGKVDISIIYALYEEISDDAKDDLDDMADDLEDEGWEVEDYKKGDYIGYEFTISDIKLMDLEKTFDVDALEDLGFSDFSIKKKGTDYVIEWDTNAKKESKNEGVSSSDLSSYGGFMEVEITLPYGAKKDNATDVSKDGKTFTWDLTDEDEIELTFSLVNVTAIIAVVIIAVVLIGGGVAAFIIIRAVKNKKALKASVEDNTVAATTATYTPAKPAGPTFSLPNDNKPEEKTSNEPERSPFAPPVDKAEDKVEEKPEADAERSPFAPLKGNPDEPERSRFAPPASYVAEMKKESDPVEIKPLEIPVTPAPAAPANNIVASKPISSAAGTAVPFPFMPGMPIAPVAPVPSAEEEKSDKADDADKTEDKNEAESSAPSPMPSIVLPNFASLSDEEDDKKDEGSEDTPSV